MTRIMTGRGVALVSGLLIACTAPAARAQDAAEADYFPIGVGYVWTYQMSVTLPEAEKMEGVGTITMTEQVRRAGQDYVRVLARIDGIPGAQEEPRYVRADESGVFAMSEAGEAESMMLPAEYAVGKTWTDASNDFPMHMTLEAIEPVTVGEMTYERCLKVVGRGEPMEGLAVESVTWYAPDIGEVKAAIDFGGALLESQIIEFSRP